jgi:hypothetical protein
MMENFIIGIIFGQPSLKRRTFSFIKPDSKKIQAGKRQNLKYEEAFKHYFSKKYLIIGLLVLLVILLFKNSIVGIALTALFIPMSKYTVRVTRFVNYITFETYTASTIMMAFMYGSTAGLWSGLFFGLYGYLSNSVTKFLALLNVFVAAIMGFLIGMFRDSFHNDFNMAFIVAILVNNVIAYFIFLVMDPDQVQNVTYRITHVLWNIFVVRLFFLVIYDVARSIVTLF